MTTTKMTSTKVRIRVFFLSCLFICFLHPSVTILPELDCRNCSKDICGIVFPQIPPCYKYSSLSLFLKREMFGKRNFSQIHFTVQIFFFFIRKRRSREFSLMMLLLRFFQTRKIPSSTFIIASREE